MNRQKAIKVSLSQEYKCPIDESFPHCQICGDEMEKSINIDINQTKRQKLCNLSICNNCAIDLANKIFNLEVN